MVVSIQRDLSPNNKLNGRLVAGPGANRAKASFAADSLQLLVRPVFLNRAHC